MMESPFASLFTWLHLSDIHFGYQDSPNRWDQKLVLKNLITDIKQRIDREPDLQPNAIFITGDLAFSGEEKQYTEMLAPWLAEVSASVGVSNERIFMVPGNHDVKRSDRKTEVHELLTKLRSGQHLDDALSDDSTRALLRGRLEAYLHFAKDFGLGAATLDTGELFWKSTLTNNQNPLRVHVIGLNTSLLCNDNNDAGKLQVGKQQIGTLSTDDSSAGNSAVIVLSHHPLDWLRDRETVTPMIKRHAHLHLCGHIHTADNEHARSGAGSDLITICSGAAHNTFYWKQRRPSWFAYVAAKWWPDIEEPVKLTAGHGYSFGSIGVCDLGKFHVRVWPFRWSERRGDFRLDVDNVEPDRPFANHRLDTLKLPGEVSDKEWRPGYDPVAFNLPVTPGLWIPTNHSLPLVPPIPIRNTDDYTFLKAVLEKHYASYIDTPLAPRKIQRVEEKWAGSLNYRVNGKTRPILFRIHKRIKQEKLRWIQKVEEIVAGSDIFPEEYRICLKPLPEDIEKHTFVPAERLAAAYYFADKAKRFTGDETELKDVASKFGRLHHFLAEKSNDLKDSGMPDFDHEAYRQALKRFDLIRDVTKWFYEHPGRTGDCSDLINLFYASLSLLEKWCEEAINFLRLLEDKSQSTSLVYHDFHPYNAFFLKHKCVLIYDYENVSLNWHEGETLAFALHRFCRIRFDFIRKSGGEAGEKLIKSTIDSFLKHYGEHRTIPERFREDLHLYIKLVNLSKLISIASQWLFPSEYPDEAGRTKREWCEEAIKFISYLREADEIERIYDSGRG